MAQQYIDQAIGFLLTIPKNLPALPLPKQKVPILENSIVSSDMSAIVRIAGLSGASAVCLGAYGSHVVRESDVDERRKKAFETGSRYHLIHTLALLAAHKARFPVATTALFVGGTVLFCGPCYHYSITGDEMWRKLTPAGGVLFILGWLSFVL